MTDLCKQCSISIRGKDTKDLANLGEERLPEGHVWLAVCEICGVTTVNDSGECVNPGCKIHGDTNGS